MDFFEASNIVFGRVRKIEPDNVAKKIIGLLLLEDSGQDMIGLAFGPEAYMRSLIEGIKIRLGLILNQIDSTLPSAPLPPPPLLPPPSPPLLPPPPPPPSPSLTSPWDFQTHRQMGSINFAQRPPLPPLPPLPPPPPPNPESLNLGEMSDEYLLNYYLNPRPRGSQRPVKACQYFIKGNCRNGNSCRYSHSLEYLSDNESGGSDMFLPGSIRMLDSDIYELLKSRMGGGPVSIASLPSMYFERYGKNLQAEGYFTESQRNGGKVGCNLTKLLAHLKCIRIIDRPNGQHSVILAEEELNYSRENRGERNRPGRIVNGSRQIYLTFPAESTFTEEDVSNYFSNYGTVEDVRIPCQEQRMFGFVNFASPDTVVMILNMPNPHFVGGARVLVKAYREKPQATERNYQANMELASYMNSDFNSTNWMTASMLDRQMIDQENEMMKNLNKLHIGQIHLGQANLGYTAINDQQPFVNEPKFQSERFNYIVDDDLSNGQTRQDNPNHHGTIFIDHNSQITNFPDSPFEYPEGSSISLNSYTTTTRAKLENRSS